MHAEIRVGDSLIMLNDDMMGGNTVKAHGGSPVSLWVYVRDCDAVFDRAVKAGARVADGPMGPMQDQFWGDRTGTIVDPEGYRWNIATHKEDLTPEENENAPGRVDATVRRGARITPREWLGARTRAPSPTMMRFQIAGRS